MEENITNFTFDILVDTNVTKIIATNLTTTHSYACIINKTNLYTYNQKIVAFRNGLTDAENYTRTIVTSYSKEILVITITPNFNSIPEISYTFDFLKKENSNTNNNGNYCNDVNDNHSF